MRLNLVAQKITDTLEQTWNLLKWIITKQPRPNKLRLFKCPNFEIFLLPYWIEYLDKKEKDKSRAACFYNSKTSNGVLQIWTFTWEKELKYHSSSMLKKFLIYDMKRRLKGLKRQFAKKLIKQYQIENHFFAETYFKKDGSFWKLWSVTTRKKSAHISYNYSLKYPDVSRKEVTKMVKTFRFVEI